MRHELNIILVAMVGSLGLNLLSVSLWLPVGVGTLLIALLMTIDLVSSYHKWPRELRPTFPWNEMIRKELLLLALIPVSLILDVVILLGATILGVPFLREDGYLWVTLTTQLWLVVATTAKLVNTIGEVSGEDRIPPTIGALVVQIQWVLRNLRRIDQARIDKSTQVQTPTRWWDDLSAEDITMVLRLVDRRRQGEGIEEPKQLLEDLLADPESESLGAREAES
jgi:hypothetical protein